ncbi:MAG TPA: alpha/beta fold hydrolase [Candidatus Binatia bacterium]|nr:alpha/beta fold hydrolase [Candidatus Binatia bacterium]
MFDLLQNLSTAWLQGAIRTLEGLRRGLTLPFPVCEDPPPTTPSQVIYEGGKLRLRCYRPAGRPQATPLLLVYALIKRPFILDLQPDNSVIANLTRQGFAVYLTDWIPPTHSDTWRGFDAYVNGDLVDAVHAVQEHAGVDQVSLLGYCFGGLLSAAYTALHPQTVKNFIALSVPLDMSKQDIPLFSLVKKMDASLLTDAWGNCPAWLIKAGFSSLSPVHHALDKYVGLYRHQGREGYAEMFELFERWMNSDVPLAGQIFRELTRDLLQLNRLALGQFRVGGQTVDLRRITCPVLNVLGEYDDVVHPQASLPLTDLVGSEDKHNLVFPVGHIGVVVSSSAHRKLWPQVGTWLKKHDHVLH